MPTPTTHHEAVRIRRTLAAIAAGLLLAACGQESDSEDVSSRSAETDTVEHTAQPGATAAKARKPPAPQPVPQPAATVAFSLTPPGATPVPVTELEISGASSVFIASRWTGVTSAHGQRLDIYDPTGVLYYSTVIPFSGTQRTDASVMLDPDGAYRVVFTLEIQGSPIEIYAMAGTWRATVSLDGTSTAAASTTILLR